MSISNRQHGDPNRTVRFRRPMQINIGIVICVIIFIYVLFHLFSYLTEKKVTIYEVKAGSIVSDHEYRALAIRKERIIDAEESGYLYYFIPNKSRAGVKTEIYSVDQTGNVIKALSDEENTSVEKLSAEDLRETETSLASFVNDYDPSNYQKTYAFKEALSETLGSLYVDAAMKAHRKEIEQSRSQDTYHIYKPPEPGFVCYSMDGHEDITKKNFTFDLFEGSNSDAQNLKGRESVEAGQAAYKLITSDLWSLVVEADEELAKQMEDKGAIEIGFSQDNTSTWATCKVKKKDGRQYLLLDLDDSMERYADQRFIDVDLMMEEESGLKIPNSSIVEKNFFVIPKDYFSIDSRSGENGITIAGGVDEDTFVSPTIFFEDKKNYYIDDTDVSAKDELVKRNSLTTYRVGSKKKTLKGVYNVNKGFAVFKQIEPLYKGDDYTIIRSGTRYGIAMYDHIVLQGALVKENDIIH